MLGEITMIKAILAVGENGEIGQNGDMPWGRGLPKDLEYFKEHTLDQTVVMGKKTFESLPCFLPSRVSAVLTTKDFPTMESESLDAYIYKIREDEVVCQGDWLIGGASIYEQFWHYVNEVHITRVKASFPEADTFFEPDLTGFEKVGVDEDVSGEYSAFVEVWRRIQ